MGCNYYAPSTLSNRLLAQNVQLVIEIEPKCDGDHNKLYAYKSVEFNIHAGHAGYEVTKPMSNWKIECTMTCPRGGLTLLTITTQLLWVLHDSTLKVLLHGILLDSNGRKCHDIRATAAGVILKCNVLSLALGGNLELDRHIRRGGTLANKVTALLDLTIEYLNPNIQNKESAMTRFSEISFRDLSDSLKGLLASPTFTNAKLVCADGVEVSANKEILASRSPVFEAMFRAKMKEAATGMVKISDISGKSMKVLVEYLTTGKLNECWRQADVVTHLAKAADKYGIQSLRDFLDDWLGEEDLVQSNLELLNMAADCGYPNAEVEIAKNIGRRVRLTRTRDEFLDAIGITRENSEKLKTGRAEKQLMRGMNSQLGQRSSTTESSLEVVNLAADEGLDVIERKLVTEVGNRLELAVSRDEVLEVLGIGTKSGKKLVAVV